MAQIVKVRILDEVACFIGGLSEDHMKYFYNKYAIPAPNYFFNPRFKLGQWDGKTHFFQSTGRTYVYLLEELLPKIVQLGYKIVLEDLRVSDKITPNDVCEDVFGHVTHPDTGEAITLRDYQLDGVNELIHNGYGILLAATSAGKTLICSAIVNAYGHHGIKTLTIVPNQDLIKQTKATYALCQLDVGEYSGARKELEHQHVVSTWQALKNNPKIVELFQLVLVDECHGAKGNVLQSILTKHSAGVIYRFGVTGTLPKDPSDLMQVHTALGPVRYEISAATLIERAVLAKPTITVYQLEEDLRDEYTKFCNEVNVGAPPTYVQFKDGYFPDFSTEKSYIHRKHDRLRWIADLIDIKRHQRGNTMVFVDSVSLGRALAALVPGSLFVNGQDVKKQADRQKIYDMFKDHDDLVVFATVHIAGTGLSINRIFALVFVDIGKSFIRIIQGVGRGLRTSSDKTEIDISDVCSDLKYGKKHLKQRTNFYDEARYPYTKRKVAYCTHD